MDHIWKAYEMARSGLFDKQIAAYLDVRRLTFCEWKKKFPAFKNAINAGRKEYKKPPEKITSDTDLNAFIYGKLPEHLKPTWEYIMDAYTKDASIDIAQLDRELGDTTEEARQALFLHTWYKCDFSIVKARNMLNISKKRWDTWQTDPIFIELFDEMDVIKSDFFESAVVNLVNRGHPGTTVSANESFNKDRYGRKVGVEVSGTIEHKHLHLVSMQELTLPLATQKEVLVAVRHHKAIQAGEALPE